MVRNYIRKTHRGMTYSKEKLKEAVAKVRSGELNGYEAATIYNIPRTTLYDYAKGKSKKSSTLGKPPALSTELEKLIAENLIALEENGFYLGRKEILDLVGLYLNSNKISTPFKSGRPGECWLSTFAKRNNVSAKPLYKEFGNQDKEVLMVKEFYSTLEMRIDELNLKDKPGQIWHIEEHSFFKGKAVNTYDKEKDITVVTACSADGRKAPLLTVFKGKESHDWMLGKHVNVSHNSGMCREVFKNYFSTAFLNYIDDTVPNLVIFEGQTSLIDLDLIKESRRVNVTLVKTPTYLENLNISIARTLKHKWSQVFGESVKEFANAISILFDNLQEIEIGDDFKNSGIHPFAAVCDGKFDVDRLKIYDEYKWFKERHRTNLNMIKDTEHVVVREDADSQMDFHIEFDSSTSMSMTEDVETPNRCSGELLKRALISVKKELMLPEETGNQFNYSGADKDLSKAEEDHLVAWFMDLINAGFKITEENLLEAVDAIQGNPFMNKRPNHYAYECFLRSHPKLKEKLTQNVSKKVTTEDIKGWLYRARMYLKKLNVEEILCNPQRIFNFGETALNLNLKDQDHDISNDITVFVTASADGIVQAPSVILPFKQPVFLNPWSKSDILNDQITDVFYDWLIEHNIQLPVVLFLDHTTNINLPLYEFCKEKKIILIPLPNTQIQPLECIFKRLKQFWNENTAIRKLQKEELAKALENYIKQDFSKEITNNFKACGLYPFNANIEYNVDMETDTKIKDKRNEKEELKQTNLLEEVEKRITRELLEEFKKSGKFWQGDPRHSSLFLFWRNICDENKEDRREPREAEDKEDSEVFVEIFLDDMSDSAVPIDVSNNNVCVNK